MTDRHEELAFLAQQARHWAELDRLFGVETAVLPRLAPAELTPAAPAAAPEPAPAPVPEDPELVARRAKNKVALDAIAARLAGCTKCALAKGRTNIVMGQGDPAAEL